MHSIHRRARPSGVNRRPLGKSLRPLGYAGLFRQRSGGRRAIRARRALAGFVIAGSALGLTACTGDTDPATNVTNLSAKLTFHGTANNGPAFTYFEYWNTSTPNIKKTTPTLNWPAGASASGIGQTVTGLTPNTSYSFRICGNDTGKTAACLTTRTFTTLAGTSYVFDRKWGGYGSGNGQFTQWPMGIATDASSNVYVADTNNNRIQKFSSTGTFITKWGSYGVGDGQLRSPKGVATDSAGNVYVADTGNDRIQEFSSTGVFIKKWGSSGTGNGLFSYPVDVATDSAGNVYVADTNNNRIQKFSSTGAFATKWGAQGNGNGQFNYPESVATDPGGGVYVADTGNNRIEKFSSTGAFITTWGSFGNGLGQLAQPEGVATDSAGSVYVTEGSGVVGYGNRVQKFGPTGGFITTWGGDGPADGQFDEPTGVATDPNGNVYVVDTHYFRIQKFRAASGADLLTKYAPTLAFDSSEQFIPIAANGITDLYYNGSDPSQSNTLKQLLGSTLAYANPALSPHLSLSTLNGPIGQAYNPPSVGTVGADFLSEHGDSDLSAVADESALVLSDPNTYADKTYGRAVYDNGSWWLQYWFFYYYDNFTVAGFGEHEGDWEMIQLQLGGDGTPVNVTYAQHHDNEAEHCPWPSVLKTTGQYGATSPTVFPGLGSHASFILPGPFLGPGGQDSTDGAGYVSHPTVIPVTGTEPWLLWPGMWGDSTGDPGTGSPGGPETQTLKWNTPSAFDAQAQRCTISQSRMAGGAPRSYSARSLSSGRQYHRLPRKPRISVRRAGDKVLVRYRLPRSRPRIVGARIVVSPVQRGRFFPPTGGVYWRHGIHQSAATKRTAILRRKGILHIPIPVGPGPYRVLAQSIAKRAESIKATRWLHR